MIVSSLLLLCGGVLSATTYYSLGDDPWGSVEWSTDPDALSGTTISGLGLTTSDELVLRHVSDVASMTVSKASLEVTTGGVLDVTSNLSVKNFSLSGNGKVDVGGDMTISVAYEENTSSAIDALTVGDNLKIAEITGAASEFTGSTFVGKTLEVTGDQASFVFPGGTFYIKERFAGKWNMTNQVVNNADLTIGENAGSAEVFYNLSGYSFVNNASGVLTVLGDKAFDKGNIVSFYNYGTATLPLLEMDNVAGVFYSSGNLTVEGDVSLKTINVDNEGTWTTGGGLTVENGSGFDNSGTMSVDGAAFFKDIAVVNSGTFTANGHLKIEGADGFVNSGALVSTYTDAVDHMDFEIKVDDFENTGSVVASGNVMVHQNGVVSNKTGSTFQVSGNVDFKSNSKVSVMSSGSSFNADGYICVWDGYHDMTVEAGASATSGEIPAVSQQGGNCRMDISSLPVELVSFGFSKENVNTLQWVTLSEINNNYFEIEASFNGGAFQKVGAVFGHGTTPDRQDYSFVLATDERGGCYRLKQVDYNGAYTYSYIICQNEIDDVATYKLEPVPSKTGQEFQVVSLSGVLDVVLVDVNGRVIDKVLVMPQSAYELVLDDEGVYFLTVNGEVTKLVVGN